MGLSRRAAVVASGRLATTASILIVNALLARAWDPETFGVFSAIWVLGNTLVPFFLLGIPAALLYMMPRRDEGQRRHLLYQTTLILAASAAVLCAMIWIGLPLFATRTQGLILTDLRQQLLAFLPYVFCLVASGHVEAALVAAGRQLWQALLSLMAAMMLIGVAATAWFLSWGVADTLAVLSMAGVLRLLLAWGAVARLGMSRTGQPGGLRPFLRYAATIGVGEGVGSLSRSVDRLVVLLFLDPSRLGIYHLGAIEVPVSLVLASLVTVMVPEVSRLMAAGAHDQVADLFQTAVARLSWLILPLFFFLFVYTDEVMRLYLPPAYEDSAGVFRCFLLMLPLRCAIYNPILVGSGRAAWALVGAAADLVVNLALSVCLVLWLRGNHAEWAILGPAAATVTATYIQVGGLLLAIGHLLDRPLWRLVPWRHLLRVSFFAVLAAWVSYGLIASVIVEPVLRVLTGGGLMLVLVWLVPAWLFVEDRAQLRAIVGALRQREVAG